MTNTEVMAAFHDANYTKTRLRLKAPPSPCHNKHRAVECGRRVVLVSTDIFPMLGGPKLPISRLGTSYR